ncbi:hypothetical protein [Notoacmeibacter sp. MSK16QG-6]|uniref:hypothetical protein n=1 Tax=Notoacmeibacter sp. MSK16QG-6 TaxID=2957982 RepID=UPI0020A07E69|nr:hypothetical protein [Notoacmeibacter sp. MSK16QG-6]MCP1200891.1 hypothetical protein [Notoacmeibacter sp. MSK16QG-6]
MAGEMRLFDDSNDLWGDEGEVANHSAQEPIAVSFRKLVGVVASQLRDIAARLDVDQAWPIDQLDKQSLDFLQNLDLHSQQLKEMAELLSHVDAMPKAQDVVEIGTCLESIARLMRES